MITSPTVFIIGAGASAPYGFPLGSDLVTRIIESTAHPDSRLLRALNLAGVDPKTTAEFSAKLQYSDASSIDTFLENNRPDFSDIGRAAITYEILRSESECAKQGLLIKNPPEDHWLKYIWAQLRTGTSASTLSQNNVQFLTFNYDRVLEQYFTTVIQAAFNLPPSDATQLCNEAFPIVHLHGEPKDVEFGEWSENAIIGNLTTIASGVRVVHDSIQSPDPGFSEAHRHLSAAASVCCLGFGYDVVNLSRLKISEITGSKVPVYGSTFGMGHAEVRRAIKRLDRTFEGGGKEVTCTVFLKEKPPLA